MQKKLFDLMKKNYEIFVVNFIALGFITFTLLAQFGVHIKVDKGVDLVPIEIGYSQSKVHINSKFVDIYERLVRLEYKNDAQKSFWMPASVAFGRTGENEIKDMIDDGDFIKRNVFINTRSNEVVGVTKRGGSKLSLYFYNSKMFRYGILLLMIVDIFVGFLIKINNTKNI